MAISQLSGINYSAEGSEITFFDAKGVRFNDNKWGLNVFGGSLYTEVSNLGSMLSDIAECIEGDIADGNGEKIAMLLLPPMQAVTFFLEGALTRNHLEAAMEGPDYIDIPGVDVLGHTLTVRVLRDFDYKFATADSDGRVL